MKNVLLNKKENQFNKFIKYFEKVKKEDLNIINYKNIESKLREIIKKNPNILRKKINEDEKINENEKKNENEKEEFLELIIPIKILDEMKLDENLKKQIELIDIPGKYLKENYLKNSIFDSLIKYSNGFLFVTKFSTTNQNDFKSIIF